MTHTLGPGRLGTSTACGWCLVAVLVEVGLYRSYAVHEASFHWFTHFFVGGGAALLAMSAAAWRLRRPVSVPLLWLLAGHLYAMFPDLLFAHGRIAHHRWMDVFLGHVSSHFVPGRKLAWYGIFLAGLAVYLMVVSRLAPAPRTASGLAVRTWGHGQPVVFLHGLGASRRYWDAVAATGDGYRGIAPDLLGFGRSALPRGSRYDVEAHVAALDPLVPAGAVVVGHSAGAIVAAALAARRPGRVRALLLIGLPVFADPQAAHREIEQMGLWPRLIVNNRPLARAACWLMCATRPLLLPIAPLLVRDVPPSVASDFLRHTWASYSRTLRHVVAEHAVAADLATGDTPTFLLYGTEDGSASPADLHSMLGALRADGHDIGVGFVDGDHQVAVRRPELVAAALSRVLAWVASRGAERRPRPRRGVGPIGDSLDRRR